MKKFAQTRLKMFTRSKTPLPASEKKNKNKNCNIVAKNITFVLPLPFSKLMVVYRTKNRRHIVNV